MKRLISPELVAILRRRCEAVKGAPPPVYACTTCEDQGIVHWPTVRKGRTYWYTLRCTCGAPATKRARWIDRKEPREGPRFWNKDIPLYTEFRDREGRPLTQQDVYSVTEQCGYEAKEHKRLHRTEEAKHEDPARVDSRPDH